MKKTTEGGSCPHFTDGRPCRGCEFSVAFELFDGGCFYEVREDPRFRTIWERNRTSLTGE